MLRQKRAWLSGAVFVALPFFLFSSSAAAALANVSHSFLADGPISNGSLVSLASNKPGYVTAANTNNGARLTGVAVNANDSLLAEDPGINRVQTAVTGSVNALVSTVNGNVSVGDQISVSPFNGIGMKAGPGLNVIGLAQSSLNSKSSDIVKETVTNKQGNKQNILVGYVNLNINITTDSSADASLNSLQKIVQNLTGHIVPTFRIVIGLVVAIITLLALITVVYSAIYGSIISIGRNPLAKRSIFTTLRSVMLMTSLVAVVACVVIYLLLS